MSRDDAAFITTRTQQAEGTTGREEHHAASCRYDSHILKGNIFSGLTLTGMNKPFYNLDYSDLHEHSVECASAVGRPAALCLWQSGGGV